MPVYFLDGFAENPMSQLTDVIDSYRRCIAHSGFFDHFYDKLFDRDENIRKMFDKVDLDKQKTMIRKAVTTLIMKKSGVQAANLSLMSIANSHGKNGLGVTPEMYAVWIDCLIQTVKEMDNAFTPELGAAWRNTLESGVGFIIDHSNG